MRKTLVIAVREYQAAVKTKAFLISLILMPVLFGGSILIRMLMRDRVDTRDKRVAVVDPSGQVFEAIAAAAAQRNEAEIPEDANRWQRDAGIYKVVEGARKQVRPRYLFEEVKPDGRPIEEIGFELSERVRNKELFAYVLIGRGVIEGARSPEGIVAYHSNSPTYDEIEDWLARPLAVRLRTLRAQQAGIDPAVVESVTAPAAVANLGLVSKDAEGRVKPAEATNILANIFMPMGLMMLMFMMIMIGAQPLLQSVIEEKMQRIAEVLLGSVTPFELMLGKLLGMVGVSLTMATLYLCGGYYVVHRAGYGSFFPSELMWWFVVFQSLAVLMYGAIFIAVGAAVTDLKEAQSLVTPVMLVVVAPMFVWMNIVREPSSTLAIVASLFPPATPMLMLMRQAVPPGVPAWQPALGIALVVLTTLVCVLLAGRIFRVGILMQGKGAKVGEMFRWALRG
ncbi:MAG: ABC transporter permease [Planctomycetes bacterium]|nr:ABC transporter permease [Planctomycetota bacterium]